MIASKSRLRYRRPSAAGTITLCLLVSHEDAIELIVSTYSTFALKTVLMKTFLSSFCCRRTVVYTPMAATPR